MKKFLIVKPSSLGDILHAFPAVSFLASREPDSRISWLVNPAFAGLLEYLPCVNGEILPFDRRGLGKVSTFSKAFFPLLRRLREEKYDAVIDMQGLLRSAFFGRIPRAPEYCGYAETKEKAARLFYTRTLSWPESAVHAVDRNCSAMADFLGYDRAVSGDYHAPVIKSHRESAAKLFPDGVFPEKLFAVAPGARWMTKQWPPEFFASVIRGVSERVPGAEFALLGAASDSGAGGAISNLVRGTVTHDLCGRTSTGELFEIIRASKCLVSNDSGPMHIAPLTGTPVVAFFGPTSPDLTGPYTENKYIVRPELGCICCFRRYCDDMACHAGTDPEDAACGVLRIMKG